MLITQTLSGISRMLREHHGEGRKLALKRKKKLMCLWWFGWYGFWLLWLLEPTGVMLKWISVYTWWLSFMLAAFCQQASPLQKGEEVLKGEIVLHSWNLRLVQQNLKNWSLDTSSLFNLSPWKYTSYLSVFQIWL